MQHVDEPRRSGRRRPREPPPWDHQGPHRRRGRREAARRCGHHRHGVPRDRRRVRHDHGVHVATCGAGSPSIPTRRPACSADRALLDTATEEFLRYFSPSQGDARTVTQDCEVAGYKFAENDRVLLSFAMPNRDPKYFPDPDTVKLDRFPNRHAAFGLGNHRCIGSNIARMQFKTIMWETLQRIPRVLGRRRTARCGTPRSVSSTATSTCPPRSHPANAEARASPRPWRSGRPSSTTKAAAAEEG